MYGFEEMAQWHAESNTSLSVNLKRWRSSNSIYMVFTHYRIVSPYHCDKGIEVSPVLEKLAIFAKYLLFSNIAANFSKNPD